MYIECAVKVNSSSVLCCVRDLTHHEKGAITLMCSQHHQSKKSLHEVWYAIDHINFCLCGLWGSEMGQFDLIGFCNKYKGREGRIKQ